MAMSVALTVSPVDSSRSNSRSSGRAATRYARSISSSVVSPMAETTTTSGRPLEAVCATRLAAARMRSAFASDEPPYFWTSTPASSADDMRAPVRQRQHQAGARYVEIPRGAFESRRNRLDLRVGAQGEDRRASARDERAQRTRLHGNVQKR